MPGQYSQMIPLTLSLPGALAAGATTKRVIVPFPYEIAGVSASVNTAPAGADLILDVLAGPNNTAAGNLASVYKTAANRPTIKAGSLDMAATSAPFDPTYADNTATEPNEPSYLAKPDPTSTATFAGNQPVTETQPGTVAVNTTEPGSSNQDQVPANRGYVGSAGDALHLSVAQVGSTTAGSDATVVVWLIER